MSEQVSREIEQNTSWWDTAQTASTDSNLVVIFAIAIVIVIFALIFFKLKGQVKSKRREIERELEYMRHVANVANKRMLLIEKHTSEYFHSLSADTSRLLFEAKELIRGIELLERRVSKRIAESDTDAIDEADEILNSPIEVSGGPNGDGKPLALHRDDWGVRLNELIELIGKDLLKVSAQARDIIPRKRDSQETYTDLLLAGIKSACENGKRLTKSFLSPFRQDS